MRHSEWENTWNGEFSVQDYRMFSVLNNVRNGSSYPPLPNRGIPYDLSFPVFDRYYKRVYSEEEIETFKKDGCYDNECEEKDALYLVKEKRSVRIEIDGFNFISDPDCHSPNWCTAQEMEECYNKVFIGDEKCGYIRWLALINFMKTFESEGDYSVRAVFWFDN